MLVLGGVALAQNPISASPPQSLPGDTASVPQTARRIDPPPGGMPFVHDPSTVIEDSGKYYVYTTGRGIPMLSSPDLVHWTRLGSVFKEIPERVHAAVPKNNGMDVWAPDVIRIGKTFYLYYAVSSWGSFRSVVALVTNTTLDPSNPSYKWVDKGVVVGSDGTEDMNDIDPGVVRGPDGALWICYGSYHGSIRVLQLDPTTGLPLIDEKVRQGVVIARESEASDIITHNGYFYLFVNHGSCCKGKNSEYNIRVGRSRSVAGPYMDKHGIALTEGGGSLFLAAHDHRIGPGHFGRVIGGSDASQNMAAAGVERFSLHYEADLTNLGRPTLGIRPLLWSPDDWPIAGDTLSAGTYQILSQASEDTLQLDAHTSAATVQASVLHLGRYLATPNQQWSIESADRGLYKLINAGTKSVLSFGAVEDGMPRPTSGPMQAEEELWRLDQLTDGSYRISNEAGDKSLTRDRQGDLSLTPFIDDDEHRWLVTSP